jgi:hypothetical protein
MSRGSPHPQFKELDCTSHRAQQFLPQGVYLSLWDWPLVQVTHPSAPNLLRHIFSRIKATTDGGRGSSPTVRSRISTLPQTRRSAPGGDLRRDCRRQQLCFLWRGSRTQCAPRQRLFAAASLIQTRQLFLDRPSRTGESPGLIKPPAAKEALILTIAIAIQAAVAEQARRIYGCCNLTGA